MDIQLHLPDDIAGAFLASCQRANLSSDAALHLLIEEFIADQQLAFTALERKQQPESFYSLEELARTHGLDS